MRGTQQKWLTSTEVLAVSLGIDADHDPQWANTGTVYFRKLGSFETLASVEYQFNDRYASFDVRDGHGNVLIPKQGGVGYCEYTGQREGSFSFAENVRRIEEKVREVSISDKPRPWEGTRVRLINDVERYPHFIAPAGSTGVVAFDSDGLLAVRLDRPLPGAETWDNEVHWTTDDGDPRMDIEVIDDEVAADTDDPDTSTAPLSTVVVCLRDPDASNDFRVFGGPVEIVDIDAGAVDLKDEEEYAEWAEGHLQVAREYDRLGQHDVAAHIRDIVESYDPSE